MPHCPAESQLVLPSWFAAWFAEWSSFFLAFQPLGDRTLAVQNPTPYSRAHWPSAQDVPAVCRARADSELRTKGVQVEVFIERTYSLSLYLAAHVADYTVNVRDRGLK